MFSTAWVLLKITQELKQEEFWITETKYCKWGFILPGMIRHNFQALLIHCFALWLCLILNPLTTD